VSIYNLSGARAQQKARLCAVHRFFLSNRDIAQMKVVYSPMSISSKSATQKEPADSDALSRLNLCPRRPMRRFLAVATTALWLLAAAFPCQGQQSQPAEENGWPFYKQALELLIEPQGGEIAALQNATDLRWIGNLDPLKTFLGKNRDALDHFYAGVLHNRCIPPDNTGLSGRPLNSFYTLIRLALLEARMARAENRPNDAIEFAAKALEGAEDLAGITDAQKRLAAVSLSERVLELFYILLNDADSSELKARIHSAMKRACKRWPRLGKSLAISRDSVLRLLDETQDQEFDLTILGLDRIEEDIDLEETRTEIEEFYKLAMQGCSLPYASARKKACFTEEWLNELRSRNPLAGALIPPMNKVLLAEGMLQAKLRATFILSAVANIMELKAQPPESLDELAPSYMGTIPIDPFSAQAFKYVVTKRRITLYSVGPDGEDERASEEWHAATGIGDIIFYLSINSTSQDEPDDTETDDISDFDVEVRRN